MRTAPILIVAVMTAIPAAVHAKNPAFGDLVSELTLPARIQPGETFMVAAKIDVAAFCRRTTQYAGPNCVQEVTPGTSAQFVLRPTSTAPETSERSVDIVGVVNRGADGVYRGQLGTLPCQKDGAYRAATQETNPALAASDMTIAAVPECASDHAAPVVKSVRVPDRLKLPSRTPADNTEWTHGRLVIEIDDDASGAYQLAYELTPADDAGTSYGGRTIDCAPCGNHWACIADIPLCAVAELGDLAVRVKWVSDRAGRQTSWPPLTEGPLAVVRCGGESTPPPALTCAPAPASDPPAPASDAGAQGQPPSLATPDAGCSIVRGGSGSAGTVPLDMIVLFGASLVLAGRARRRRRDC